MKKLITVILSLTALAFATYAQAAAITIAGIQNITMLDEDDFVTGSASTGGCASGTGCASDFVTVSLDVTLDAATDPSINAVLSYTDEDSLATYVVRKDNDSNAYLDISFNDSVTGANDLVFFFVGGNIGQDNDAGFTTNFDLDIDLDGTIDTTSRIAHFIPTYKDVLGNDTPTIVVNPDAFRTGNGQLEYTLTAARVDLSTSGLGLTDQLGSFHVYLDDAWPYTALSGVGYIPAMAPIPLPLPIVLFASGLGVLGLFGRRKSQK